MTQDYQSPIQPGKNIVVGQAAILWGEAFTHGDRGRIEGGWILPGMVRTTNGEYASRVCRELNEAIKASNRLNRLPTVAEVEEDIGAIIARSMKECF